MSIKRVMVIYSHKDKRGVEDIIEHLRGAGIEVWFDQGIQGGGRLGIRYSQKHSGFRLCSTNA